MLSGLGLLTKLISVEGWREGGVVKDPMLLETRKSLLIEKENAREIKVCKGKEFIDSDDNLEIYRFGPNDFVLFYK